MNTARTNNRFHRIFRLILIVPLVLPGLLPARQTSQGEHARGEKIRLILHLQDQRVEHSDTLIRFFHDPDPVVRARVALSYGSLQDTSVLPFLLDLLSDQDSEVERNAAFAVGQTAGLISENSRVSLQHDLLHRRLDNMKSDTATGRSPVDRCIEEIGKFGDEQTLRELVSRFAAGSVVLHRYALIMSIARFAIRGITDSVATEFLIRSSREDSAVSWEVAYALQRIGPRKEIRGNLRSLMSLCRHPDPLFRMNLATLLGKMKDSAVSVEPLMKLAWSDPDWRVRVNALKALSNFDFRSHRGLLDLFAGMLSDKNPNVGLTAISSLGSSNLEGDSLVSGGSTFERLSDIAGNRDRKFAGEFQGEAALALARLTGARALGMIRIDDAVNPVLKNELIQALGSTGSLSVAPTLLRIAGGSDHYNARAALEGLDELTRRNRKDQSLRDSVCKCLLTVLVSPDVALRTTAASFLGDSLYRRPSSVPYLIKALQLSRIPDDIEAMQEIAASLGILHDTLAVSPLVALLQVKDRSVVHAAARALHEITGRDYRAEESTPFPPVYSDYDFGYLDSLPPVIRVKLTTNRGDIVMDISKASAPFTVMNFLKLATRRGLYNGTIFHRVVPNFVIQGGDPRGDGWGGPGYTIRSEFSPLGYDTGTVGIASAGKDTEGSQFFITQSPQPHLDGRYTIIGKVVAGMDVVSHIIIGDSIGTVSIVH